MKTIRKEKKGNHFLKMLVLLVLPLVFAACSKDDDVPQPTVTDLLTSGKWYIESVSGATINNPACEKKTYYLFLQNGDLLVESFSIDNENNCVSEIVSATWELLQENTLKITSVNNNVELAEIVSITQTELILKSGNITIIYDKIPG